LKSGFLESDKIGSLQIHTGYLIFSLKNPAYSIYFKLAPLPSTSYLATCH